MKTCERCKKECEPDGCSAGYAIYRHGDVEETLCFDCAAVQSKQDLIEDGSTKRVTLYLTIAEPLPGDDSFISSRDSSQVVTVTDWSGRLRFKVIRHWTGQHNWYYMNHLPVHFAWFIGPDGLIWSGKNIGDNEVLRAKRLKNQPKL